MQQLQYNFYHYSDKIIDKLDDRSYKEHRIDLEMKIKPRGFWFSVEGIEEPDNYNWKQWCEAEEFRLEYLRCVHQIHFREDANILHLKTADELIEFSKNYPVPNERNPWHIELDASFQLDWLKVKADYQGIIIAPYQWGCRLAIETSWYYGWDCSSGCVWDLSCIKEFKPVIEKVQKCV